MITQLLVFAAAEAVPAATAPTAPVQVNVATQTVKPKKKVVGKASRVAVKGHPKAVPGQKQPRVAKAKPVWVTDAMLEAKKYVTMDELNAYFEAKKADLIKDACAQCQKSTEETTQTTTTETTTTQTEEPAATEEQAASDEEDTTAE